MAREPASSYDALQAALERLAASPEQQVAWLSRIGTYTCLDELAFSFEDELLRVRDGLPREHPLRDLDRKLEEMSGRDNAALWSAEALQGTAWDQVRALARDGLTELNARPR